MMQFWFAVGPEGLEAKKRPRITKTSETTYAQL